MANHIKDWFNKAVNTFRLLRLVERSHFVYGLNRDESKKLFKKSVYLMEIETFSFCNRKCWFCPNSIIDRASNNIYLDSELYKKVLSDLQAIDYNRTISYGRYNEPLADAVILERIALARKLLPNARLHISTNGDYLTQELLNNLNGAGLNNLSIQVYFDGNGDNNAYNDIVADEACMETGKKTGVLLYKAYFIPQRIVRFHGKFRNIDIAVTAKNFISEGVNRGGLVNIPSSYMRTAPCHVPFTAMYIDYNGSVMPCCNLRSDYTGHKKYILSTLDLKNSDIFTAYSASSSVKWRKSLLNFLQKEVPCDTCHFHEARFFKNIINKTAEKSIN